VVGRVIERGVDLGKDDTMDINPGVPQDVPGIRQRVMETTEFVLASALPALLWALRAAVFRRLPAKTGLFVDLALFLVSVPICDMAHWTGDEFSGRCRRSQPRRRRGVRAAVPRLASAYFDLAGPRPDSRDQKSARPSTRRKRS
jgi:hypothetical protein